MLEIISGSIESFIKINKPNLSAFVNSLPDENEIEISDIMSMDIALKHNLTFKQYNECYGLIRDKYNNVYAEKFAFVNTSFSGYEKYHPLPPYISYDKVGKEGRLKLKINEKEIAKYFEENYHYFFMQEQGSDSGVPYIYDESGVYRAIGKNQLKTIIRNILENALKPYGYENLASARVITQAYENIIIAPDQSYYKTADCINRNEYIINFANGILKFDESGNYEFSEEHSPDFVSTIQLPVDYTNEKIPTPTFDKYLKDMVIAEDQDNLKRFLAFAISNFFGARLKKALIIIGQGNCGKSVLFSLVNHLIGANNFFTFELNKADTRFYTYNSIGKRIGGYADMQISSVNSTTSFKSMTGGDEIRIESKGVNGINFKYTGILMYGSNQLPILHTAEEAVYDRILPITCNPPLPPEQRNSNLINELIQESQGIVMSLIPYLQELIRKDFKIELSNSSIDILSTYRGLNSSAIAFYQDCCTMQKQEGYERLPLKTVRKMYLNFCDDNGLNKCNINQFNSAIRDYLKTNNIFSTTSQNERSYKFYVDRNKYHLE